MAINRLQRKRHTNEFPGNSLGHLRDNRLAIVAAISIYLLNLPLGYGFRVGEVALTIIAAGLVVSRQQVSSKALFVILPSAIIAIGIWIGTLRGTGTWDGVFQPCHYLLTLSTLSVFFSLLNTRAIIRFLVTSMWSLGITALLAICIYFLFPHIGDSYGWIQAKRMALWVGVNRLGYIFATGITLGFGLIGTGILKRTTGLLLLFTIVIALTTTMSIGSFISAFVGVVTVLVSLFVNRDTKKNRWFILVITILLIVTLPNFISYLDKSGVIPERYTQRVTKLHLYLEKGQQPTDEGSYKNRISDIADALELIAAKPILGYGGGQQEWTGIYPHTLPILLYLEGGLLAVSGLSVLALIGFFILVRNWRSHNFRRWAPVSTGIFAVFITGLATHAHMYAIDYSGILIAVFFLVTKKESNMMSSPQIFGPAHY